MSASDIHSDREKYVAGIQKIATALESYKKKNRMSYPRTLEGLVPRYLAAEDLWIPTVNKQNPLRKERLIYLDRQGYRTLAGGKKILAVTSNEAPNGGRLFIDEDCKVLQFNEAGFQAMLARQQTKMPNDADVRDAVIVPPTPP